MQLKLEEAKWNAKLLLQKLKNPFSNHMIDKIKMDEAHEPSW